MKGGGGLSFVPIENKGLLVPKFYGISEGENVERVDRLSGVMRVLLYTVANKLPSRMEREAAFRKRHEEFLAWLEESKTFVAKHRADGFRSFESPDEIPKIRLGWTEEIRKTSIDIPEAYRSDKNGFCLLVLKIFAQAVENAYDGDYLMGCDKESSDPSLFVFRRLANGQLGICQFKLTVEGFLLVVQVNYVGYEENRILAPESFQLEYSDSGVFANIFNFPDMFLYLLGYGFWVGMVGWFGGMVGLGVFEYYRENENEYPVQGNDYFFDFVLGGFMIGVIIGLLVGFGKFCWEVNTGEVDRYHNRLRRFTPTFDYLAQNELFAREADHRIFAERLVSALDLITGGLEARLKNLQQHK